MSRGLPNGERYCLYQGSDGESIMPCITAKTFLIRDYENLDLRHHVQSRRGEGRSFGRECMPVTAKFFRIINSYLIIETAIQLTF